MLLAVEAVSFAFSSEGAAGLGDSSFGVVLVSESGSCFGVSLLVSSVSASAGVTVSDAAAVVSLDESTVAFATSLEEATASVVNTVAVCAPSSVADDFAESVRWPGVAASVPAPVTEAVDLAAVVDVDGDDVVVLAVATAAAPPIDASAFVTLVTTLAIAVTMAWANAETFCTA